MKAILSMILVYCLMLTTVFAQATNPNNTFKIGNGASASDKGFIFDTNDGVSNKKLVVEKTTKRLKYDGNSFQLGDGSAVANKVFNFAGVNKNLTYNYTLAQFEFDAPVLATIMKANSMKTNSIDTVSGTETAIEQNARVKGSLKIGTGTNELRVSGGNLEFSNDGALYKKIGSGSGSGGSSGTNLLTNDSFEDGTTPGWTSSGGTYSQQTYSVGSESDLKYGRFIATISGQYVEQIVSVPTNFGAGCQADFKKVNIATAGLFKVQALDVSNNILAEQIIGSSAWIKVPTINFPCPATGTNNLKLRLTSLAAGTIDFDKGYIGSNQNLVYSSQAKIFGTLKGSATSNCVWVINSTTFSDFPVDNDCPTMSATGGLSAPATKIPGFNIASAPAGEYVIYARGRFGSSGTSANVTGFRFTDGITLDVSQTPGVNPPNYESSSSMIMGRFSYATAQTNLNFKVQAKVDNTSPNAAYISLDYVDLEFVVFYYPSGSEVAVSNDQASWFIDANIGGTNPNLGTGNVFSYQEIIEANLDLVVNTQKGSAPAEIPCSTTNPSTGLTCAAGSESVGIAFIPPSAGVYEVCMGYAVQTQGMNIITQLVSTPNNSQTILEEGGERLNAYGGTNTHVTMRNCANFIFTDTSKKTIRLMREQSAGTSSALLTDRDVNSGQRDIHVTVKPLLSAYNRPTLTGDQVTSPGSNKPVFHSIDLVCNASSSIVRQSSPGKFTAVSNIATGKCTITAALGVFAAAPYCYSQWNGGGNAYGTITVQENSATAIDITGYQSASTATSGFQAKVTCFGNQP